MTAIFSGLARIGRDAELRHTPNGDAVINLSLAFEVGQKDRDGNWMSFWVEAGLWGDMAKRMVDDLTKGRQVFVVIEKLHEEEYKKRDGSPGKKVAGRISAIKTTWGTNTGQPAQRAPQQQAAPASRQKPQPAAAGGSGFDDEDIPF
jgi:single-strand DNA-binding protein